MTPSIVVRRSVYEQLGGFDLRFSCCGEDWEMWVRIATQYPIYYEVQPLALYRVKRPGSLTENSVQTNKLVRDMRLATEIIESYLPESLSLEIAHQLTAQARLTYGFWALEPVESLLADGKLKSAFQQLQEALNCSRSSIILRKVVSCFVRGQLQWLKKTTINPMLKKISIR